jgi:hypothetical protein
MPVTLALLMILAAVGIVDVGYYHLYKHRLFAEPAARLEQIAHLCRGALFVAMLCLVVPVPPRGRWVDAGIALFVADTINTVADTWIERTSRPSGLDHGEYMVHVLGSVLAGATALAYAFEAWPSRSAPTGLTLRDAPVFVAWIAWPFVGLVASVVVLEGALHLRARWRGAFAASCRPLKEACT